ncbi:methyl-accepting chemotaxis protein [Metabacillus iocasae]|uniref:Methyl-accepting chemotaxis protein n=1 Tax=Priestia iocasae TaxID=2291674 RepID=A0ABS2QX49_9BACI|nr:methyl-accepting chemotaxis protein [Metabacillus iocasae]MBM7704064.1 methyl-accepting chemotaxis protein [Metabacillus iocasae]
MGEKSHYRFGLRVKLVIFISVLAIITYSTSAFFIYFVYPFVQSYINEHIFTVSTLVLGIFWSGLLAYLAAGFIIRPLQELERVAKKAAEGIMTEEVKVSTSDDEIRALGLAFNKMLGNVKGIIRNINQNFDHTNEGVISISASSSEAAIQAENIARTIDEISKGAEGAAVSIQETSESVDEVIVIAEKVQQKAHTSMQLSAEMVGTLQASKEATDSLIQGIHILATNNEQSLDAVQRLEQHAKQVEHIISLVGDIAGQTNLLALNASIEAARAGEQGKGFAVVAEEVRKLADESAKAVQGITSLIHNIQDEVKNVVVHIQKQVATARQEATKGNETTKEITIMTQSVHQVVEAVKDITGLVEQQMESIRYTAQQSQEVAAIAEETSAGAQEVNAATQQQSALIDQIDETSKQLSMQAKELKETIQQFTI